MKELQVHTETTRYLMTNHTRLATRPDILWVFGVNELGELEDDFFPLYKEIDYFFYLGKREIEQNRKRCTTLVFILNFLKIYVNVLFVYLFFVICVLFSRIALFRIHEKKARNNQHLT